MNKNLNILFFILSLALLSACGGGSISMVKKSAANKIQRVAVVSVMTENNSTFSSADDVIKKLLKKTVDITTSGLTNIHGWKTKHPDTFINSKEYKDFNSKINEIWGMYTKNITGYSSETAYNGLMPHLPINKNILFAGSKEEASNKVYAKLCNALNVDALAFITVSYNYNFEGMATNASDKGYILPTVSMGIKIINKFGESAVNNQGFGVTVAGTKNIIVTATNDSGADINIATVKITSSKGDMEHHSLDLKGTKDTNAVNVFFDKSPVNDYSKLLIKAIEQLAQNINLGFGT